MPKLNATLREAFNTIRCSSKSWKNILCATNNFNKYNMLFVRHYSTHPCMSSLISKFVLGGVLIYIAINSFLWFTHFGMLWAAGPRLVLLAPGEHNSSHAWKGRRNSGTGAFSLRNAFKNHSASLQPNHCRWAIKGFWLRGVGLHEHRCDGNRKNSVWSINRARPLGVVPSTYVDKPVNSIRIGSVQPTLPHRTFEHYAQHAFKNISGPTCNTNVT